MSNENKNPITGTPTEAKPLSPHQASSSSMPKVTTPEKPAAGQHGFKSDDQPLGPHTK